jgi:signal peptidase II
MLAFARRAPWTRLFTLLSVAALVGCDHVTKFAAKAELGQGGVRPIVSDLFQLRYAENRDVAFNLLAWVPEATRGPLLLATGVLAITLLAVWVLRGRGLGLVQKAGATLILAGALGNTLDRVVRGYVVDFMRLPHWPIFNVADVYVCAGVALLLLGKAPSASASPSPSPKRNGVRR